MAVLTAVKKYPRVTSVLGVLRKIGLEYWFKNNTAEFCDTESARSKEIGSQIHKIIQESIESSDGKISDIETQYPNEVTMALKNFFAFKKDFPNIRLKRSEVSVTSEIYGYTGTLDCLAVEKGELFLFDWKTGKCDVGTKKEKEFPPIYPEHLYQVSAYVKAYNEQFKANIKSARVLALSKDKAAYNYFMVTENAINEMFEEVFLSALKIYNYEKKSGGK